jgi:hypothetical protein
MCPWAHLLDVLKHPQSPPVLANSTLTYSSPLYYFVQAAEDKFESRRMDSAMNIGKIKFQNNLKQWKPKEYKPRLVHLLAEIARRGGRCDAWFTRISNK